MADIEANITSNQPCENDTEQIDGVYECILHRISQKAVRRFLIPAGPLNPLDVMDLGQLIWVAMNQTRERLTPYAKRDQLPIDQLVGLTVVRACIRQAPHQDGVTDPRLRGERVVAYGFVPDYKEIQPAQYGALSRDRVVSSMGTGHLRIGKNGRNQFVDAIHLPATPEEQKAYPVNYAVPTLSASVGKSNSWLALRAMPEEELFVETLVTREKLQDILQPPA